MRGDGKEKPKTSEHSSRALATPCREGVPTASKRSLPKSRVNVHRQHSLSRVPGPGCHPCKEEIVYPFHR